MQRRSAVAAASAISMSLLSGVVLVGAHLGALGFGSSAAAPTATPAAMTAPAAAPNQPTATADGAGAQVKTREADDAAHPAVRIVYDPDRPIEHAKRSTR